MADSTQNPADHNGQSAVQPTVIDLEAAFDGMNLEDESAADERLESLMSNLLISNEHNPIGPQIAPDAFRQDAYHRQIHAWLVSRGQFVWYPLEQFVKDRDGCVADLVLGLYLQVALGWVDDQPRMTPDDIRLVLELLSKWSRVRFAQSMRHFDYGIDIRIDLQNSQMAITISDLKGNAPQAIHITLLSIWSRRDMFRAQR
ncbi:MAG: hypothetical protein M1814_002763 [Vezdaea aestivalis]|nr:MAG: hypothetical protein M1814_002763 [Vezdaea aestivalis]